MLGGGGGGGVRGIKKNTILIISWQQAMGVLFKDKSRNVQLGSKHITNQSLTHPIKHLCWEIHSPAPEFRLIIISIIVVLCAIWMSELLFRSMLRKAQISPTLSSRKQLSPCHRFLNKTAECSIYSGSGWISLIGPARN